MTWFSVADRRKQRFSPHGLGVDRTPQPLFEGGTGSVLPKGTLVVEATVTGEGKPELLFGYQHRSRPAARSLKVQSIPGGGVSLISTLGRQTRHAAIRHGGEGRMDVLRISYAWDTTRAWARLAVERPGGVQVFSSLITDPLPILVADLHKAMMTPQGIPANVIFCALSTKIEPLGPSPSLMPDLEIHSTLGTRQIGELKRGDTLAVASGEHCPLLYPVRRRVPALGSFRPVRLRAPYFGLTRDIVVAPTQRLVITGSAVEYTYAREAVLIPAGHLVNGTAARFELCGPVIEYTQLLMPAHETLSIAGCALESLYIGRIRRKKEALDASILCDLPSASLPEHAKPMHPVLGAFEARILADQRAA